MKPKGRVESLKSAHFPRRHIVLFVVVEPRINLLIRGLIDKARKLLPSLFLTDGKNAFVADPARVVFTPTVQYIPRGLKGIIKCQTDANPPITYITWKKDSRLFDPFNTAGIMALLNGSLLIDQVSFTWLIVLLCQPDWWCFDVHNSKRKHFIKTMLLLGQPTACRPIPMPAFQSKGKCRSITNHTSHYQRSSHFAQSTQCRIHQKCGRLGFLFLPGGRNSHTRDPLEEGKHMFFTPNFSGKKRVIIFKLLPLRFFPVQKCTEFTMRTYKKEHFSWRYNFRWTASSCLNDASVSWEAKWLCPICASPITVSTNVLCPMKWRPLLLEQLSWLREQHRMHPPTWLSPALKLLQWPSSGTRDTVDARHANKPTKSGTMQ